jgi:20S proteasome alpha/beta subunit
MTVCIAALCRVPGSSVWGIVGASDRMITTGDIEFEPPQRKVYNFTDHVIALVSGDMAAQISICTATLASITAAAATEVAQIADHYSAALSTYRRKQAERDVLLPLGFTLESFHERQRDLAPALLDTLTSKLWKYSLEAESIIAGIDSSGAHLYVVKSPGDVICLDAVGFAAVGYGRWHAESQFMFAEYVPGWSLSSALFLLYSAKRRAEVAPSVGLDTDLALITAQEGYVSVSAQVTERLREVYEEAQRAEEAADEVARGKVEEFLNASLARPPEPDPLPATAGGQSTGVSGAPIEPGKAASVEHRQTPEIELRRGRPAAGADPGRIPS